MSLESRRPVYDYHNVFTLCTTDGTLGLFWGFAVMKNNTAVNILIQTFMNVYVYMGVSLREILLGLKEYIHSTLLGNAKSFSKVVKTVYTPTAG